jgi:SAM-dependent methyltransferase
VVVADLRRTPLAAGVFSGVWASASLLHLSRAQAPVALDEAARILQPGGVMFSSVKAGRGERRSKDGRRFVLHTREDWGRMVEAAGFRLLSLEAAEGSSTARTGPGTWIICFAALP